MFYSHFDVISDQQIIDGLSCKIYQLGQRTENIVLRSTFGNITRTNATICNLNSAILTFVHFVVGDK